MGSTSRKTKSVYLIPYADKLVNAFKQYCKDVVLCGSLRRNCDLASDIDIVVTEPTCDYHKVISDTLNVEVKIEHLGGKNSRSCFSCRVENVPIPLKIDIWEANPDSLGAAILYATGPGISNVVMRRWARSQGLELYFNGVFDKDNNRIAALTEEECCLAINWDLDKPELRFEDDRYFGKYLDILNGEV